ncbi:hypothetical protein FEQ05_03538 [Burkholderia pseudomultivorans]|uniref:Capsule assembly Wzi family protein n=1 Tax=Burkholderia pseudomultivorans TaxID=1207504 RepID=A0ABU2E2Q9_9BURK|nr:hypothetical protein [Burkholderia pseudomultivorans]MDR8736321.1 hypothetical protein [Burkholderia pseudomultivorans]MDR8742135.1 hypothetical protein [Burkholderia pseudomultivorans]MDR8753919.1 hypothetical protein [Burkholderia pseudomultivorans]MDR8778971.1 hypothetical protein [Burkholderia pseudomultivorans]
MRIDVCNHPLNPLKNILLGSLFTICMSTQASPLVIGAGDDNLRGDLQWLADRGIIQLSTSTWPLPVDAIQGALDHADLASLATADQAALDRVRTKLLRLQNPIPELRLGVKTSTSQIPHAFADQPIGNQEASISSSLANFWIGGRLQVGTIRATPYSGGSNTNLDGSYIGIEALGQLLYFGRVDRFWGPGSTGSLGLGNTARPLTAVTLQRASNAAPESRWLNWIGPWTYQIFEGEEQDYNAVPGTHVFGMRLQFKPFNAVEIGLYRAWQWGGDGRPYGWSAWWNNFKGNSNLGDAAGVTMANKSGAQQAGGDIRWNTSVFGFPWATYAQINGADGGGNGNFHLPSHNAFLIGSELKTLFQDNAMTWRVEAVDTKASRFFGLGGDGSGGIYTSQVWTDGYYQQGLPLGYAIGGDGKLFSAGVDIVRPNGIRYGLNLLHMSVNGANTNINAAYPVRDNINALALKASYPLSFGDISATVAAQKSHIHNFDAAGMVILNVDFEKF